MYLISDEAVEEEEESMIDLAQALYAAGVRPEPLFSISEEENLCREEPERQIVLSPILSEDTSSASGLHDVDDMDDEDTNKVCTCLIPGASFAFQYLRGLGNFRCKRDI